MWSILNFGKYKGKSLPQVILHDPDYFFWVFEKGIFDKGMFVEQARILEVRACNIKIPKAKPDDWCVRYYTDPNGRFAGFDIIEIAENSQRLDSIEMWREANLDLSVARRFKSYDKLGGRILLRAFKYYFFGSEDIRRTKQRCEEFFSNENNFALTSTKGPGRLFSNHKVPSTWDELLMERKKQIRREVEEENNPSCEVDDSGETSRTLFTDPDYFPSLCRKGAISTQTCLELISEFVDQTVQSEGEEEISEEEWFAQIEEEGKLYRARERKRLEEEAEYSWEASERLRALIEKEEEQKALAECAEDERRREAIKAEAEESPLNWLFPETDSCRSAKMVS
jgi:hypothetical protein